MSGPRNNKTSRGRIHRSTRAIFYENLQRGLDDKFPGVEAQAPKIRWLMAHAHISRTHAQRLINANRYSETEQGPSIDTLAFIAEAFGVTASQFLVQGCKFHEQIEARPQENSLGSDGENSGNFGPLQRPRGSGAARRRAT